MVPPLALRPRPSRERPSGSSTPLFLPSRASAAEPARSPEIARGAARSLLRRPSFAHTVVDAFALGQENRVVGIGGGAETRDRESGTEREPCLDRLSSVSQPPEMRERGGQHQMREPEIAVSVDRPAKPRSRFLVDAEMQLRAAP